MISDYLEKKIVMSNFRYNIYMYFTITKNKLYVLSHKIEILLEKLIVNLYSRDKIVHALG